MWEKLFNELSFFPEQASTIAPAVDTVYFFAVSVTIFFTLLIFAVIIFVITKFARRSEEEVPRPIHGSAPLEIIWSIIPFVITMVLFGWGAYIFFQYARPPANAMDIHVVGKQWMWKIQHPEGKREINELHVPLGQPVRIILTSEDVIHDFYLPAFRVKRDAVPGRYNTFWFEPTKTGEYHLFCAEYCGTEHSLMRGTVHVMEPQDYDEWLREDDGFEDPAVAGERLFTRLRCDTCHTPGGVGRAPSLANLYGSQVTLQDGERAIADEAYIRESILDPTHQVVAGFGPSPMPTFQGQVTEEQILELIAYIRTLGAEQAQGVVQQ